jgi:hypothetical protein
MLNPDSEIVTQPKELVSGRLPVSPFPSKGRAVTRRKNSGVFNRDNGKHEEAYEEE